MLFFKFSRFSHSKVLSNTFGKTSLSLLTYFNSIEDIASTPVEQLANFIIENSKNHIKRPQQVAETIQQLARNSYRLNPSLIDPINTILASVYTNITQLQQQISKIDKAIEKQLSIFPNEVKILTSIRGIGHVFAAGIIAETGSISKFKKQISYGKYTSLIWKRRQSGKFQSDESFLTKKGNRYLRYYLIEAAESVRRYEAVFRRYYKKKYLEAVKHHHKRALVLTARKLARIIYYLLRDNKLYTR